MRIIFLVMSLFLIGCTSKPVKDTQDQPNAGRYHIDNDIAPNSPISIEHIEDAHPRYEPKSLYGNKDYTLLSKNYSIVKDPKGFSQEGISSWYGNKFHGHKTSNGEVYDMYSMSAAHKTLPIPSYVKVTNKDNGRAAIVRVNDRGPFHEGRIIDLSFAAATKLDVIRTGTTNVNVEYIAIEKPKNIQNWHAIDPNQYHIQMVALNTQERANSAALALQKQFNAPTNIMKSKTIYRVRLGPFVDRDIANDLLIKAKSDKYPSAFIIQESKK